MSSDESQEEGTSAPTPVRELMGADPSPARVGPDGGSPVERKPPRSEFHADGEDWIAEERGKTRTGEASDSGAILLLVGFRRAGRAEAGDEAVGSNQGGPEEGEPEREAWSVARSLEDLSELQLTELLGRSRPWRNPDVGESDAGGRRPGPGRQRLRTTGGGD